MSNFQKILKKFTPVQIIIFFYAIAVVVAFLILRLPFLYRSKEMISITDTFFTAVTSISVTGLSTISIIDTYNEWGIILIALFCQIGGVGVMGLSTFFWMMSGKKIGLKERMLLMTDNNQTKYGKIVSMIKQILIIIVMAEAIGTIALSIHFLKYFDSIGEAVLHGFFGAVSATTNAGLDLTGESLIPYAHDYYIQIIYMILIVIGSIGFPVLVEVKSYLFHREQQKYRFTLYTKLTTSTFGLLLLIGTLGILLLGWTSFFVDKSGTETVFYALFQSVTTRSGGMATMDMNLFSTPVILFMSVLMFIGASPNSVGGGIRTTTFAINVLALKSFILGKDTVTIFKREISTRDVIKSFVITFVAISLCTIATIALLYTEGLAPLSIIFEVCSAFGTTGLSMGITSDLSNIGKWIIMALMFIGRVGILALLLSFKSKTTRPNIKYPVESVLIG